MAKCHCGSNGLASGNITFLPLSFNNGFILEYKTLSWTLNYSIVGSSSILRILDHCHPQNICYFEFCGELHFQFYILAVFFHKNLLVAEDFLWIKRNSKQWLKGNSTLEIFVEKFPCWRKIHEALVVYGLKHYLIIYPYAAGSVITIWLVVAIKASYEQSNDLLWKNSFYGRRDIANRCSETFPKNYIKHLCRSPFSIKLQAIGREYLFYGISPGDCF